MCAFVHACVRVVSRAILIFPREITLCLHAIGSVLIYYAVYGYDWAVVFRRSIIMAPIRLMTK